MQVNLKATRIILLYKFRIWAQSGVGICRCAWSWIMILLVRWAYRRASTDSLDSLNYDPKLWPKLWKPTRDAHMESHSQPEFNKYVIMNDIGQAS